MTIKHEKRGAQQWLKYDPLWSFGRRISAARRRLRVNKGWRYFLACTCNLTKCSQVVNREPTTHLTFCYTNLLNISVPFDKQQTTAQYSAPTGKFTSQRTCESTKSRDWSWTGATFSGLSSSVRHSRQSCAGSGLILGVRLYTELRRRMPRQASRSVVSSVYGTSQPQSSSFPTLQHVASPGNNLDSTNSNSVRIAQIRPIVTDDSRSVVDVC